jgi:predicted NUDIX family NTP pyrophosphohydrolase
VPTSCGVILYRRGPAGLEVFLVHPGGPVWANKDEGAWTIPKGQPEGGEEPEETARREFEEETGITLDVSLTEIGTVRQKAGKVVHGFAAELDIDTRHLKCNTFKMEWPARSGRYQEFAEVDRWEWFPVEEAKVKINPAQREFIDRISP